MTNEFEPFDPIHFSNQIGLTVADVQKTIAVARDRMADSRIVIDVDDVTFTPAGGNPITISRVIPLGFSVEEPARNANCDPMGKPLAEWFRGKLGANS